MVTATPLIFKRVEREGVQIAKRLCNCSANEAVTVTAVVNWIPTKPAESLPENKRASVCLLPLNGFQSK